MELTNSLQIGRHRCGLEHLAQSDGGLLFSHVDVRVWEWNCYGTIEI